MNGTPNRSVCAVLASIFLTMTMSTGCFNLGTDFTYGKSADQSVNGVSVFANLLRERGHSVSRKGRLSKRVDKFDTIFWAPNNIENPPENVVAWFEQWMAKGDPRVMIFVGRTYDATIPYYRGKLERAEADDRENWQRELADVLMQSREYNFDWNFGSPDPAEQYWFEAEEDLKLDNSNLGGPWAEGIDANAVSLETSTLLKPLKDYNDEKSYPTLAIDSTNEYDEYESWFEDFRESKLSAKELLTVDGQPFAFEVSSPDSPGRKLIVISNGSFLLNLPLLEPEHQKLASMVADHVTGDVVFIESDSRWPRVGGGANDPALRWTWIGKAPMNYIVPHFLFWGVLYCFVFYPNFGRPKRIQFHPPKAFRSHVQAVASILGRSKERSWAREIIDMWLKRNNKTKS